MLIALIRDCVGDLWHHILAVTLEQLQARPYKKGYSQEREDGTG